MEKEIKSVDGHPISVILQSNKHIVIQGISNMNKVVLSSEPKVQQQNHSLR